MSNLSRKDAVWNKAKKIPGKDRTKFRQDPYGNEMKYHDYGKNSKYGWNIDHIKPKARGGSNEIGNLQAMNSEVNQQKGDSLVKKSRHSRGNK